MFFVSAATTQTDIESALQDLLAQVRQQTQERFEGQPQTGWADLLLVFLSPHYTHTGRKLIEALRADLKPGALLGCSAEGVIAREQEIEDQAAISIVAAHLPNVSVSPFIIQAPDTDWHPLLFNQEEFQRVVDAPQDTRLFILLGDPFSTPMDDVLEALNSAFPGIPAVGGMASGALRPYGNILCVNDRIVQEGLVGVALAGELEVDVVVSQGCRPIWRPFRVVTAHRNVIFNLEGRPPLAWIEDLIPELPEEDRTLLENGLYIGRAIKPGQDLLGRGDFLIRGVIGADQQNGAIAIGDSVMEGEVVQFHLRDAFAAQEDLEMMLIPQAFRQPASGALLFTCNGRGRRLYDFPNGDIAIIAPSLGSPHLAGFFCAGEIGPIGSTNFLHGQTASLALFRAPHP